MTVAELDPSREGLRKAIGNEIEDDDDNQKVGEGSELSGRQKRTGPGDAAQKPKKKLWNKKQEGTKKKKKFRYESKEERKFTRLKERAGNRKHAQARRAKQ